MKLGRNDLCHCGVKPMQMANWLYALFDELQWVTISTPDDLSSSVSFRLDSVTRAHRLRFNDSFETQPTNQFKRGK